MLEIGKHSYTKRLIQVVLVFILVVGGWAVARYLVATAPKAERKAQPTRAVTVETVTLSSGTQTVLIDTTARISAARDLTLFPEVTGTVEKLNPRLRPGETFSNGTVLLELDDDDFQLALREAQSGLKTTEADYEMEQGEQARARHEYAIAGKSISPEYEALALRKPQLKKAKAAIEKARAIRDQAQINLERTKIRAPFDGTLTELSIAPGSRVAATTPLLKLIDSKRLWLYAEVNDVDMRYIEFANEQGTGGSIVTIPNTDITGRVLHRLPDVDSASRKPRVLIEIEGDDASAGLAVGSFTRVHISGRLLPESFTLPWPLLRDNDTVWLMGDSKKLTIKQVEVLHRGRETVIVRGLSDGARIVKTNLSGAVEGIQLRNGTQSTTRR